MNKILVLIIILLMVSCAGTRNVQKNKIEERIAQQSSGGSSVKINSEIKINYLDIFQKMENSELNSLKLLSESSKERTTSTVEKINTETSKKTYKSKEYYENGSIKLETEFSEDYGKLSNERDYWKASAEANKEASEKKDFQIASLTNSNIKLNAENTRLSDEKKSYKAKFESSKKVTSNKTDRHFYSYAGYVLAFGLGLLSFWLIRWAWNRLKYSQSYF